MSRLVLCILSVVVLLCAELLLRSAVANSKDRPNIVFIKAELHRAGLQGLREIRVLRALDFPVRGRHRRSEMPLADVAGSVADTAKHFTERESLGGKPQPQKSPGAA